MRLKPLFAALALSGCGTVKPFPDVDYCTGIAGTPDYAYCVSYYEKSNREYRLTNKEVFTKNMIMVTPEAYGAIEKYIGYLTQEASKRCK